MHAGRTGKCFSCLCWLGFLLCCNRHIILDAWSGTSRKKSLEQNEEQEEQPYHDASPPGIEASIEENRALNRAENQHPGKGSRHGAHPATQKRSPHHHGSNHVQLETGSGCRIPRGHLKSGDHTSQGCAKSIQSVNRNFGVADREPHHARGGFTSSDCV